MKREQGRGKGSGEGRGQDRGQGSGYGAINYLPSIWLMEPDLSRCLCAVNQAQANPALDFNALRLSFARLPVYSYFSFEPRLVRRIILPPDGQRETGMFLPHAMTTPAQTVSRDGTRVYLPRTTTTPAQTGSGDGMAIDQKNESTWLNRLFAPTHST